MRERLGRRLLGFWYVSWYWWMIVVLVKRPKGDSAVSTYDEGTSKWPLIRDGLGTHGRNMGSPSPAQPALSHSFFPALSHDLLSTCEVSGTVLVIEIQPQTGHRLLFHEA